jgi:hypothetical protein
MRLRGQDFLAPTLFERLETGSISAVRDRR